MGDHARGRSGPAVQALRQQGPDDAAQHITRARRRHARVAERADRIAAVRIRDDGAAALEHHHRRALLGQALGGGHPVLLNLRRRAIQQAAGFGRMRRQHPAALRRTGPVGLARQQIEAIGIEHDRDRRIHAGREEFPRPLGLAEAGAGHQGIGLFQ
jgi:hypothetical protein